MQQVEFFAPWATVQELQRGLEVARVVEVDLGILNSWYYGKKVKGGNEFKKEEAHLSVVRGGAVFDALRDMVIDCPHWATKAAVHAEASADSRKRNATVPSAISKAWKVGSSSWYTRWGAK